MKPADLVEFTDLPQRSYTIGDPKLARYGVVRSITPAYVVVETTAGVEHVPTHHIHAEAWVGWIPEGLESIQNRIYAEHYGADDDAWGCY